MIRKSSGLIVSSASPVPFQGVRRFKTANQTGLATFTEVPITMGGTGYDIGTAADVSGEGIIINTTGYWLVSSTAWFNVATGAGDRSLLIKSGSTTIREYGGRASGKYNFTDTVPLTAGMVITLSAYLGVSGEAIAGGNTYNTTLSASFIGS